MKALELKAQQLQYLAKIPSFGTPLFGREHEVNEICEKLRKEARLLTLTGPGGTGKTRLSLDIAAFLIPDFADGGSFYRTGRID